MVLRSEAIKCLKLKSDKNVLKYKFFFAVSRNSKKKHFKEIKFSFTQQLDQKFVKSMLNVAYESIKIA